MNEQSDLELLSEFAERRSEAPFGALVRRYVNLVHSTASRLTADRHLAEDVSQGVFVALAQQAGAVARKIAKGAPLSGWLHLTTRNIAAKTVRTEMRRRAREQAVAAMSTPDPADRSWEQLAPQLDDALADLEETDRHALLLRFFEGQTAREIAQRLGLSEEAAQKRVVRALERLRQQFARRHVATTSAGIAGLLSAYAVQAAPAALAVGITAAAVGSAVAGSSIPLGLAVGSKFTSALVMTKIQTATLAGLVLAAAIPISVQHQALRRAHAALTAASQQVPPFAPLQAGASPAPAGSPEAAEIERLRREIQALRAQLTAANPKLPAPVPVGPTLLVPGQAVRLEELVYAGTATPAATLQSWLAWQRDGDLDRTQDLELSPLSEADRRMLATEEGREQGKAMLKAQVQSVERLELLEQRPISEQRTQLVYREFRTDRILTNTVSLGHTSQGWKLTL